MDKQDRQAGVPCEGAKIESTGLLAQMAHGADRAQVATILDLDPEDILDFSANINPYGFTPAMQEALKTASGHIQQYPDPHARPLLEALAQRRQLEAWQIVPGNGGADLIFRLAGVFARLFGSKERQASRKAQVLLTAPTFSEYAQAFSQAGFVLQSYPLAPDWDFQVGPGILDSLDETIQVCILCQPNNPTGLTIDPSLLTQIRQACRNRGIYLVMDECFLDFLDPADQPVYSLKTGLSEQEIIIKSLTKLFAIPGLRLGWLELGSSNLADQVRAATPPWQVSGPAQAVGLAALATPEEDIQAWRQQLAGERQRLSRALTQAGAKVYPSQANFLFFAWDYPTLQLDLLTQSKPPILIRNCANYRGLGPGFWRVAVKSPAENDTLIAALKSLGGGQTISTTLLQQGQDIGHSEARQARQTARKTQTPAHPEPAKAIMVLGTASSVGKSALATGLCRLLTQEGYRVRPFKSQNMSREYYSLPKGGRLATAQALMAEACRTDLQPEMNPVLLVPRSDTGSDVYVLGQYWQSLAAKDYYQVRNQLWPTVQAAYQKLAAEADIIVVEGAGSPAEINLRQDDFVNLGLADRLDLPCILVGDIDRGGVFASLYGTLALCQDQGGDHIKALVINKFRGDPAILKPGLVDFKELTGLPILGTLPYLPDLQLDAEDSLSDQEGHYSRTQREASYDRLADNLRQHLDWAALMEIVNGHKL